MKFKKYLSEKPLFYQKFDFERMPRLYNKIKGTLHTKPIIHIIGTNGKGSTGRFITQLLEKEGKSVGHFSSPHIFKFNERFYKNGKDVEDEELESAHKELQRVLGGDIDEISYFEYATFIAMILFRECEFWVFEAGLGGEFDSTNVLEKKLTLFTPIGLDHTNVLGDSIEKISLTKLRAMGAVAVLNSSMDKTALHLAQDLAKQRGSKLFLADELITKFEKEQIKNYIQKNSLAHYQESNLSLAYAGFKLLGFSSIDGLGRLNIAGRLQRISSNITIDVGHNPLCAKAIRDEIYPKKVVLVYNSFLDKDVKSVLYNLKDIVKRIEIYRYESKDRALATDIIKDIAKELDIECLYFNSIKKDENYLVFGSFMLVEEFLKGEFYDTSKSL